MSNEDYTSNINRRYPTNNINTRLQRYLNSYNNFLIDHKDDMNNAKKMNQFTKNVSNIETELNNLENTLNNISNEIIEKNNYLEQSNGILDNHKLINKNSKQQLKELQNTNAGAIGMYHDIAEIYKYVIVEYILIIIGIIGVIYKTKK